MDGGGAVEKRGRKERGIDNKKKCKAKKKKKMKKNVVSVFFTVPHPRRRLCRRDEGSLSRQLQRKGKVSFAGKEREWERAEKEEEQRN